MGETSIDEAGTATQRAACTQLHHLVGYAEMLKQDALEAGREDVASLFTTIGESALGLEGPLLARFDGTMGESGAERLDHEIYGILYAIIALIQEVKVKAASGGDKGLALDADKLLDAGNAILELMAADEGSNAGKESAEDGEKEPRPDLSAVELAPAPRPGRILVVDDNLFNRELLSRHLERQGHEVRAAGDGLAALELLRSEAFDVAIIDVMMPGMNGYQLLERMRAEKNLRGVHAIVISALEDTQIIARCIQLGAEDYLPREFEPVILKARIESCLEKKRMKEEQELVVKALVEAQEKLELELRGGASYVRSLLPARLASPELAIDWKFIPSASLGGDVFGYHLLGGEKRGAVKGKLALYLIDVSGHGIEAALFSVTLMNMLKTQVLPGADFAEPASVLDRLNASFKMEEQNNLFFTAWYGIWDHGSRELTYASAGSPPAILILPDGTSEELSTGGMIVGVEADAHYDSARASIPRGSGLYVFSDGVYEFRAKDGTIFGIERFSSALVRVASSKRGGRKVLDRILDGAKAECSSRRFPDDVSLLELRFD
ncbi:MAG: fused response regulator/phosphatase [Rectinemataceae bacterium]|jgi:sigma-B regulation protein RsbU (phosphoserine phosphatase)